MRRHSLVCSLWRLQAVVIVMAGLGLAENSFVPGRVLVRFKPEVSATQASAIVTALGGRTEKQIHQIGVHIVQLPGGANEKALLNGARQRPEVAAAELDEIVPPSEFVPDDPYYSSQWHLPKISAPAAWAKTMGSIAVIIAILDTGVDNVHEELAAKQVAGWNFYDDTPYTQDVQGHGTRVAGTAAAYTNNAIGVASVCPTCQLMPLRIADLNGYAYFSTMATALTWAADHGARVANLSFNANASTTLAAAAQYFASKGGVLAMSAGNDGATATIPDNPDFLTVSAIDPNDQPYSWTNRGSNIDLAAPGCVYTTARGSAYGSVCGTSFSAPIVAGAAGMLISLRPELTAAETMKYLREGADDLGPAGWDPVYGAGRVNVARALALANGIVPEPVDATPPIVQIVSPWSGSTVAGAVAIALNASDNVGVSQVWFAVAGTRVCSFTAPPYSCTWNSTAVADGNHVLTAYAKDAAGNVGTSSVSVTVSNTPDKTPPTVSITSPTAGVHVDGQTQVTVAAADNRGVVRVDLLVNGAVVASSNAAPFTTRFNARKYTGSISLQVRAYDAAGNSAMSAVTGVYR